MELALTSFSIGLLATTSPCVLPLYPGYLAYIAGASSARTGRLTAGFLGFFVLLGVLVMMMFLGALIALLSISIGRALSFVVPLADLTIITLGVMLLLNINVFKQIPQVRVPVVSHPFGNAFFYGLLYGPIALPCSGPLLVSIFALSFTVEEALGRLAVFLWFGLGFGLPLLVLSLISGASQRWITRQFALHSRSINLISGLLLISVGVYDLIVNLEFIRLSLRL
jgi:cytochrome c-type biogenesis protein